jgi:hypothetical protein
MRMKKTNFDFMDSNEESSIKSIDSNDVEFIKSELLKQNFDKKIRFVSHWMWWNLQASEKDLDLLTNEGVKPSALYAENLVWDEYGIFEVGLCIKTTPLQELKQFMGANLYITKGTIYVLVGPGHRSDITLEMYDSICF